MSLYVCDKCHAIENTALGNYWSVIYRDGEGPKLCSECTTGFWHGRFEKRRATPGEIESRRDEFMETAGLRAVLAETDSPRAATTRCQHCGSTRGQLETCPHCGMGEP